MTPIVIHKHPRHYLVQIPNNPDIRTFSYLKDARVFARKQAQPGQKIELAW